MTAATAWAFAQRTGSAGAKAVLLALAHYGVAGLCRATARDLARLTDQSEDAVHAALDVLEGRDLVRREDDGARGKALVVRLRLPGAAV